jgi:hypothetical protein
MGEVGLKFMGGAGLKFMGGAALQRCVLIAQ